VRKLSSATLQHVQWPRCSFIAAIKKLDAVEKYCWRQLEAVGRELKANGALQDIRKLMGFWLEAAADIRS
jgi:hypothetical protein